jgi:hypothetical protein
VDATHLPPELADRFEVHRVLGSGSTGAVLEVLDRRLGRAVALKRAILEAGPLTTARFLREARALARVEHPGIVRVHDVLQSGEEVFLVTEILEGVAMDQLPLDTDPLGPMLDVAEALEAVHEADLLHRDVKPANLFRTREGRGVILDFGLAYLDDRTRLTDSGMVVGTPAYMAPEVLSGSRAGPAADWYAWGISLFWMYERRVPFGPATLQAYLAGEPDPVEEVSYVVLTPDHPARRMVEACLDPDPLRRPRGRSDLERLARGRRSRRRRRGRGATDSVPALSHRVAPRHGRGRILGGVLGVGLVAALVGATLGRRSPVRAPPSPTPPPLSGEVRRVRDALEQELAIGLGLSPHPAPLDWLEVAERRPGIQVAYHYLSRGPDPRKLSEEARRTLRDLDGRLVSAGGPELFAPWLDLADFPPWFLIPNDMSYVPDELQGQRVEGPMADLLHAFQKARAHFRELDRRLEEAEGPEDLPDARIPVAYLSRVGLRHLLEQASGDPERSRNAELWAYPASRRMRTTLLAAARFLESAPEDGGLDAWPAGLASTLRAFLLTGLAALPLEVLVPGEPRSSGAWTLRAVVLRGLIHVRRSGDRPWRNLVDARIHALTQAAALAPGGPEAGLPQGNLEGRVRCLLLLGREDQARELVAHHLDFMTRDGSSGDFGEVVRLLAESWVRNRQDIQTRRVVARVLERFERTRPRPDRRWYLKLRGAVKTLQEAFTAEESPGR